MRFFQIPGLILTLLCFTLTLVHAQEEGKVHIGGYGSIRYEANDLDNQVNTFTFRRFVMTTYVPITGRLSFLSELELERFRLLELEKKTEGESGVTVEQALEGTGGSEISLEQAWLQWELSSALRFRAGGILVPLGRFNINHDDNIWMFPRRSLVDRGAPVLPVKSAWDELGMGFNGRFMVGEQAQLSYEMYVVNGMVLDVEVENKYRTRIDEGMKRVAELKFEPFTGSFSSDAKEAKALTGRLALSPTLGTEVGLSGYYGRYTPQYLPAEQVGSVGVDFLINRGSLALEGEYIYTSMGDVRSVASAFAGQVQNQVAEVVLEDPDGPGIEDEIEVALSGLSDSRQGYWLEARYAFSPAFLRGTVLGQEEQPLWYLGARWEQVWYNNLVQEAAFADGALSEFVTSDRQVNRLSLGLTFRPTPLVGFQLAYERTWTDDGQSLADVVNFLAAEPDEDVAQAFLFGVTFGF